MGEEHSTDAPANKKNKKLIVGIVVAVVVVAAAAFWYVSYQIPHSQAVASFETAASGLEDRNAALDSAVDDLQTLVSSGDKPYDSATTDAANTAISQAQEARADVPEMPSGTAEINAAASDIDGMGDYSSQLDALATASTNLQNSIDQLKQVTNPTEQFVIERLTGLANITATEAVTEDNDPNGKLNKAGGYTAAVNFSSDLVDQSKVFLDPSFTGLAAAGCDGGGTVEVYSTSDEAKARDTYLAAFDGTVLSPGSHSVVGSCVVRTSDLLTASQQKTLEQEITQSLLRMD